MSDLVGNPKAQFSRIAAHMYGITVFIGVEYVHTFFCFLFSSSAFSFFTISSSALSRTSANV